MLFLLTNDEGHALLIAETGTKAEADEFGRTHLPEFSDSVEIDPQSHAEAEEFWNVRTVRIPNEEPPLSASQAGAGQMVQFWVRGPELPEEVIADGLLTPEDHKAITLDHIQRTCSFVFQLRIEKRA